MNGDFLYGGSSTATRKLSSRKNKEIRPVLIGPRFILSVALVAGMISSLGLWRVHLVFTTRDYQMETRRIQDVTQRQHDRMLVLQGRLGELQRDEVLRRTAIEQYGMIDPNPNEVVYLTLPVDVRERWFESAREETPAIRNSEEEVMPESGVTW